MKRIAVLSDIHGNILALEEVLKDIERREIDLIVNLGDHVSGPLWPKETIDFLKQQDWVQISGNHDRQLINQNPKEYGLSDFFASQQLDSDDFNWLRALPSSAEIYNEIVLFHGSPRDDNLYLVETVECGRARLSSQDEISKRIGSTKSAVILCGHSHIPRIVETSEGQLVINPGSVGLPAFDDEGPEPHVMETGSPHARYALLDNHHNKRVVKIIAVSYDYQKAADQAQKNGRSDWAIGLKTGYMEL